MGTSPARRGATTGLLISAVLLLASGPAAADDKPLVLIVPVTGQLTGPLAAAPTRFDGVLAEVAVEAGGEPLTAGIGKAELGAIMGCADGESTDCFEESATTLGVDRILFGQVATQPDGKATVSLTYFESGQPVRRKQVVLASREVDPAVEEVRTAARELLGLQQAPPPPPPPDLPPPPPPGPEPAPGPGFALGRVRPWTWGVAGGGVALLGLSALFFTLAGDKQDQVDAAPTDTLDDLHRLEDLERSGRRLTLLGNVSLIVGAAAVTTGAVLIWRQGRAPAEQPAVAITPVSGGGAGLVWNGTF